MKLAFICFWMLMTVAMAVGEPPLLEAPRAPEPLLEAEKPEATPAPDEDFPAFLAAVALLSIVGSLLMIGAGIVVAGIVAAGVAVLALLGILSSSVLVAVFRRRVTAGMRALHYQVLGGLGVLMGWGALAVWAQFSAAVWHTRDVLLIGTLAGGSAGLAMAYVLDRIVSALRRRLAGALGV